MNPAAEAVMQSALAQIVANGSAFEPMQVRIATDTRLARIKAMTPAEHPITTHGRIGFMQMISGLHSSSQWRRNRAGYLSAARKAQIEGFPKPALMFLSKAAWCRRSEMTYRASEIPTQHEAA